MAHLDSISDVQRLLLGVVGISYLDLKMLSCADDQICKEQCKKLMQASSFSKRRGLRRPCLTSLLLVSCKTWNILLLLLLLLRVCTPSCIKSPSNAAMRCTRPMQFA